MTHILRNWLKVNLAGYLLIAMNNYVWYWLTSSQYICLRKNRKHSDRYKTLSNLAEELSPNLYTKMSQKKWNRKKIISTNGSSRRSRFKLNQSLSNHFFFVTLSYLEVVLLYLACCFISSKYLGRTLHAA